MTKRCPKWVSNKAATKIAKQYLKSFCQLNPRSKGLRPKLSLMAPIEVLLLIHTKPRRVPKDSLNHKLKCRNRSNNCRSNNKNNNSRLVSSKTVTLKWKRSSKTTKSSKRSLCRNIRKSRRKEAILISLKTRLIRSNSNKCNHIFSKRTKWPRLKRPSRIQPKLFLMPTRFHNRQVLTWLAQLIHKIRTII